MKASIVCPLPIFRPAPPCIPSVRTLLEPKTRPLLDANARSAAGAGHARALRLAAWRTPNIASLDARGVHLALPWKRVWFVRVPALEKNALSRSRALALCLRSVAVSLASKQALSPPQASLPRDGKA